MKDNIEMVSNSIKSAKKLSLYGKINKINQVKAAGSSTTSIHFYQNAPPLLPGIQWSSLPLTKPKHYIS